MNLSNARRLQTSFGLLQINLRGLKGAIAPGNLLHFSPLSLETVFPALKQTQNCYINMDISFFWKTGNLIIN